MTDFVGTPLDCAVLRPRPVDTTYDPVQTTTQCVWHTAVSGAHDPGPPFPAPGTPNFGVDWTGYLDEDGTLYQYRGIEINVDATDDANVRAIAFESWDGAAPEDNPWTPAQIAKMKEAMLELHDRLGIPLRTCALWDEPGFGYHRLFPEWDKPYHYHSCPGDTRAQQWADEIVPWLKLAAAGQLPAPAPPTPTPTPEDPTMDENGIVEAIKSLYALAGNSDGKGQLTWVHDILAKPRDQWAGAVAYVAAALAG